MRASLSFELSRQAAPLVPQQQQHSPSGSSDSGYKSESSTDGAKSYVSQDSQDLFAYKSTYRRDSTGPTSHQAQGPKLQDFGELQQSAELRCLQASSQIVLGGGETHTKDVSLPTFEKAIPLDLRQNPRRSGQSRDTTQTAASQPPCTLRRGAVKRDCFVTRLVTFASQLVGAIWPNANNPPRNDSCMGGKGVLPLDQFISEVLRRSRTSYSTLQIAMYYLILLRPYLPMCDFTKEQPANSAGDDTFRALQCGRRMFLSALILASKYLQDRNYSTRAWSKISGLPVQQINRNEARYCEALDWRLHFPCKAFEKWSCITVRLCSVSGAPGAPFEMLADRIGWSTVVLRLATPDALAEGCFDFSVPGPVQMLTPPASDCGSDEGAADPLWADGSETSSASGRTSPAVSDCSSTSSGSSTWELQYNQNTLPTLPPVPQLRNLPTPQGTPQSNPDLFRPFSRRPSICSAISQARKECLLKATLDSCPPPAAQPILPIKPLNPELAYRSSHCRSTASLSSSPESMTSDDSTLSSVSSCTSRSSSISSACAPLSQIRLSDIVQRPTLKASANGFMTRPTDTSASSSLRYCLTPSTATPRSDIAEESCPPTYDSIFQPIWPAKQCDESSMVLTREELEVADSLQSLRSGLSSSTTSSSETTPQPKAAAPPLKHTATSILHPGPTHLFGALPISQNPSPRAGLSDCSSSSTPTPTPSTVKRTHSKANARPRPNTALHAQVRENLRFSEQPTVCANLPAGTPPHSPESPSESRAHQSPVSNWAPTKVPILPRRGCVKRLCSSSDLKGKGSIKDSAAVEEARRLLRQSQCQGVGRPKRRGVAAMPR